MSRDPPLPQKDFVPGLAVRVIADDAVMLGEKARLTGRRGPRAASPDYLRFLP